MLDRSTEKQPQAPTRRDGPVPVGVVTCLSLFMLAGVSVGCRDCGSEPVPFKANANDPSQDTESATSKSEATAEPGISLPAKTRHVKLDGATLAVPEGELRAVLPADLNDDEAQDAVALIARSGGAELVYAKRAGMGFGAPIALPKALAAVPGCDVQEAQAERLGGQQALFRVKRTCTETPAPESEVLFLVTLSNPPRMQERFTLTAGSDGEGNALPEVSAAGRALDQDGDGHLDFVLEVSVTPRATNAPAATSLLWLNRPAGLARDTREPTETLTRLAEDGKLEVAAHPEVALKRALEAQALFDAVCREGGAPRLLLGDGAAIPCGVPEPLAAAVKLEVDVLTQQGKLAEALKARQRFVHQHGARVDKKQLAQIDEALAKAEGLPDIAEVEGPTVNAKASAPQELPALGFSVEGTVLVRSTTPRAWHFASQQLVDEAPHLKDQRILDPSGKFFVHKIAHSCEGVTLTIMATADVVGGIVAGRPTATPVLKRSRPDTPCDPSRLDKDNLFGLKILGWAPQGIVLARDEALFVVPMTQTGQSAGDAVPLDETTPVPAPLAPGWANVNASAYALPSPAGIVIYRPGSGAAQPLIVRPHHWPKDGRAEVAISPSGRRLAFLAEGKLYLAELEGAPEVRSQMPDLSHDELGTPTGDSTAGFGAPEGAGTVTP